MECKTKIQKVFVDNGCGFPVVIKDVPMIHVRGVWTPDINYNTLHKVVARALAYKPTRLTGNEIKFVRDYFGLTLADFGKFFDVSHLTVTKWENSGDDTPSIRKSLERDLRLFTLDQLKEKSKALGVDTANGLQKRGWSLGGWERESGFSDCQEGSVLRWRLLLYWGSRGWDED